MLTIITEISLCIHFCLVVKHILWLLMEKDSSLIARITVTNSREMSLRSTKTMVKIEEIYKDNSANLAVGDCIF